MDLLKIYTPKELAAKTIKELAEKRKVREIDINDYHYRAVSKSIAKREGRLR